MPSLQLSSECSKESYAFLLFHSHTVTRYHGSHVAGIIASRSYGVAKKANLLSIRAFDSASRCSNVNVILALQDIYEYALQHASGRIHIVANLSYSSKHTEAADEAVAKLAAAGVVVVASAGNNNDDACKKSPGSSPAAITVGAVDLLGRRAYFSNFGRCVDIFAPGVDIPSLNWSGKERVASGTSVAAPHVAGIAALVLSSGHYTSVEEVRQKILSLSTPAWWNLGPGSPSRLAFNGGLSLA